MYRHFQCYPLNYTIIKNMLFHSKIQLVSLCVTVGHLHPCLILVRQTGGLPKWSYWQDYTVHTTERLIDLPTNVRLGWKLTNTQACWTVVTIITLKSFIMQVLAKSERQIWMNILLIFFMDVQRNGDLKGKRKIELILAVNRALPLLWQTWQSGKQMWFLNYEQAEL
jgi:hypothetical protein